MRLHYRSSRRSMFALVLALCAIGFTGCSDEDDDNPVDPGSSSTELTGAFANANEGGQMSITIPLPTGNLAPARLAGSALAHDVSVTGTLYPDTGDTIGLTGIYNEEANSLVLSGGGYTLSGAYDAANTPPGVAGTYSGPNGTGIFGCAVGGSSSVLVLCGSLTDLGVTYTERWHLVVAGNAAAGVAIMEDGEIIPFEGTVGGVSPGRTLSVNHDLGDGRSLIASGTVYTNAEISNGTWELDEGTIADPMGFWSAHDCENPPPSAAQLESH
ncbi:MAG TPA: hypothetical protein VFP58_14850 [Candidatus Eisenbacteria bacterium]|nr:hypothetical protein [Candidatus Eisenbacteria bacterium]